MKNLMDYSKARGIILLDKYLPDISPFKDICIVESLEKWEDIKHGYGEFAIQRVDLPIGSAKHNAVSGASGLTKDVPELIKCVKSLSEDGIVLVMNTKSPCCFRYQNDGGFNVLFSVGNRIIIELVGKGFDGHELTQGIACHERYTLEWNEAYFRKDRNDLIRGKDQTYLVGKEEYVVQRKERIEFLVNDCHYDKRIVEENVPLEYREFKNELVGELLDKIILKMLENKSSFNKNGLWNFCVQGNFVNGTVQPWEFFIPERWA